jgi:NAD-dependent DNA ligase
MAKINKSFINNLVKDPIGVLRALDADTIASVIQKANHVYYNQNKPLFTDQIYDVIKEYLAETTPKHPILKHIGATIDVGNKKVKLPHFMGSLDKIKSDVKTLENWKKKFQGNVVISDKLDGNSGLLVFDANKSEMSLFTRGDGYEGQNISHLLPFLKTSFSQSRTSRESYAIRGELIISKEDFAKIAHKGANARNMVAGLLNSKVPDLGVAALTSFVAYEVIQPKLDPNDQMAFIKDVAQLPYVYHKFLGEADVSVEMLSQELVVRRRVSPFEIDGIVVMHNKIHPRVFENPEYGFAFKSVLTMDKAEVTVLKVEWNMSKDGIYVPVVHFTPVALDGVIIAKAHGFNGKYIKDNVIGPGAVILIMRSGAVIPYIIETLVKASKPQMPDAPFVWSKTGVEIMVDPTIGNSGTSEELKFKNMEYFFDKIDVKGLSGGILKKLFDKGFKTVGSILGLNKEALMTVEGFQETLADKIHKAIDVRRKGLDAYLIMDASNVLGRGIGYKKIKMICDVFPQIVSERYVPSLAELVVIKGIESKTAELFIKNLPKLFEFVDNNDIQGFSVNSGTSATTQQNEKVTGKTFVFTGIRDKDLEAYIEQNGGVVGSGVNKNISAVIVKTLDSDSSKATKAKQLNIPLMTMEQFKEYIGV